MPKTYNIILNRENKNIFLKLECDKGDHFPHVYPVQFLKFQLQHKRNIDKRDANRKRGSQITLIFSWHEPIYETPKS